MGEYMKDEDQKYSSYRKLLISIAGTPITSQVLHF
jgi:hypothetical protein